MTLFLISGTTEDKFFIKVVPENKDESKEFEVEHSIWDKDSLVELNSILNNFATK